MKVKNEKLIKSALIVSAGGLISKVLGAIYRIPLTNLLGGYGMGLYQTVFPMYTVLLTFSSTGVPTGISKLIAQGENSYCVLRKSKKLFGIIGFLGTVTMFFSGFTVAKLQGSGEAGYLYLVLSPSVFLVSLISAYRGYFQGKNDMVPTAVSQITEQSVKLLSGLMLAVIFKGKILLSVITCVSAVTVSEVVALLYLIAKSKKPNGQLVEFADNVSYKSVVKTVIPITLTAVMIPLSRVIDSFTVVNLMSAYTSDAVSLYGLYSGAVESLVGMPVTVCYGVAVALIPVIAKEKANGDESNADGNVKTSVVLTFVLSAVCMLGFLAFSVLAVNVLYGSLETGYKRLLVSLLKTASFTIIPLACLQTFNAVLVAENKLCLPPVFLSVGITVKTVTLIIMLKRPEINVFAIAYSDILCYTVACFCDLVYYISISQKLTVKKPTLNAVTE